jgi:putative phosphoserine phosphatase/1-acylglycerol-3-phosphate O-acyltransferase
MRSTNEHRRSEAYLMASTQEAIATILNGPGGPKIAAFFDFDGTLIDGYSAAAYFADRLRHGEMGFFELVNTAKMMTMGDLNAAEFAEVIGKGIGDWGGRTEEEMYELWLRLFKEKIAACLFPEAWKLIKAHQKIGHTVVIASSATRYQVAPTAAELGIDHVLCTQAMVRRGRLSGGLVGEPLWGAGKAAAVREFAKTQRLNLKRCYGYANGNEDIDFLKAVGHAIAVNPKALLEQTAEERGWTVLRFALRRRPSITTITRTLGAYGAMGTAFLGGMAYAKATGNNRRAADLIGSIGFNAALAIAGVEVETFGEHNVWTHRPAVFLLNHQSKLDFYIMFSLLRRDFTGVAKKEAENTPGFKTFMKLTEMAFIDRGNTTKAIEALQPAVERLRKGLSVCMAPEGTRSYSPRLGRFKKGAFHVAMQAGVPVVPVVIRNAGELMSRSALTMRSGKVQVAVRPAIDVTRWKVDELDKRIKKVRQLYIDTLDNWPGSADSQGS